MCARSLSLSLGQRKIAVFQLYQAPPLWILGEEDMPQILPMFLGAYLHLDLKHQTNEYIYLPSSLRLRVEMTQECLFGHDLPYVALHSFLPVFTVAPLESRWRTEH